jgi:hypothetical protein
LGKKDFHFQQQVGFPFKPLPPIHGHTGVTVIGFHFLLRINAATYHNSNALVS